MHHNSVRVDLFVADSSSVVVVLLLQVCRDDGHGVLRAAQEAEPGVVPARVPPRHHVPHLVDGRQVGRRRTV